MDKPFSKAFKASLSVHVAVIVLLLVGPLLSRCVRPKPKENIIFVEMVTPSPPSPPAPPAPPEPKVPEPVKPPEPEPVKPIEEPKLVEAPPKKKEIKVSTNVVKRTDTPPPAPPPPKTISAEELAKNLMSNLPRSSSPSPSASNPSDLARYYGSVQGILYQAWQQPPGVAGLSTKVSIRIAKNGSITDRKLLAGSGSKSMDDSVMSALKSVSSLPRLPDSINRAFIDVTITFKSEGVTM